MDFLEPKPRRQAWPLFGLDPGKERTSKKDTGCAGDILYGSLLDPPMGTFFAHFKLTFGEFCIFGEAKCICMVSFLVQKAFHLNLRILYDEYS